MDQQLPPFSRPSGRGSGGSNTMRAVVMAAATMVFTGYLLLLAFSPTNTFKRNWLPSLIAKTTTTYFGTQGAIYLIFTLPVLLIALLGCIYLHLGKASSDNHLKKYNADNRPGIWRRPMTLKGLGIVSLTELAFFLMFVALLAWNLGTYIRNDFETITPQSLKAGEKLWTARLRRTGLRLGMVGNIALSFLFFPVARGSSVLQLFGLTSEASIQYHIWVGHMVLSLFTAHGLCYITSWAASNSLSGMLLWSKTGVAIVAGEIALLAGLVMWATAIPRIRRTMFRLFYYTHHLYIVFVIFFVLHVGISYSSIMLPSFFIFMIDRYLRFLQSRQGIRLRAARVLHCEVVELNFSKTKSLTYTPTSIMFVNIPSISKLQWHPFSVTSSSNLESDNISVMIKREGRWSSKLYEILASPNPVDRLEASIEGPYGPSLTHFIRHDLIVMVSGGSGITPFISIIRELIHMGEASKYNIPKVLLISSFKNSVDLTMLDLILPISGTPSELAIMGIQIEAYITREKHPTTQEKKPIQTIWFKPKPSDAPLAPILGPNNNWLWLAAIILSSFIIYLVSIAILTRYYIYPIDHNTNKIYPSAARSILHILFLCIGVAITATVAFLWNKSRNAREINQVLNMEGTDREVESFPQQSLSRCINVHYGERPDLKKYLSDRKESSIGVLASGPMQLRQNAAKICSSGWGTNLHFESISFSW